MTPPAPAPANIDDYIARFPPNVREILENLRAVIRQAAPDAQEAINYGMPTFKLNGNLVHFAAYARHIGFYPSPSAIEQFQSELSRYKFAKGSVQFPLDQPIPYDLVRRVVIFRVQEQGKPKSNST